MNCSKCKAPGICICDNAPPATGGAIEKDEAIARGLGHVGDRRMIEDMYGDADD